MSDSTSFNHFTRPRIGLVSNQGRIHESARLPSPLTPFIGRETEIASVLSLFRHSGRRLITLSGPAGVGKSRLALEIAARIDESIADEVAFVSLASLTDAQLVSVEIAQAFSLHDDGNGRLAQRLSGTLQDRRVLLILDSFDRVNEAASFLVEMLSSSPSLRVLVTTRRVLGVSGEWNVSLPPFSHVDSGAQPTFEVLAANEAVQLFVERAAAAQGEFTLTSENAEVIAEICARLDGLPLAIELAAAQTVLFDSAATLARIERHLPLLIEGPSDAPDRQRTMDGAIGWSYEQLSSDVQAVFRCLSVCVGGFSLAAAAAVTIPAADAESQVVASITRLIGMSLVSRQVRGNGETRFVMLETIRQYGWKQLEKRNELDQVRRRHATYFLTLAEEAAPALYGGPNQQVWLDRLTLDLDNIRASLNWAIEHDAELGQRIAGSMFWFWYLRGYLGEGREWLVRTLASSETTSAVVRGRVLLGLGMLAQRQGEDARAVELLTQSTDFLKNDGSPIDSALAIGLLGIVAEDAGDFLRAKELFQRALSAFDISPEAHQHPLTGLTFAHLGVVSWGLQELLEARRYLDIAVEVHRAAMDDWGVANATGYLGLLACQLRDFSHAAELMRESLALFWSSGSLEDVSNGLASVATLAANRGEPEIAARLFGSSEALRERIGSRFRPPEREMYASAIESLQVTLGDAFAQQSAVGRTRDTQAAVDEAIEFASAQDDREKPGRDAERAIQLTARERDVLRLLVEGRTDKEIATALFISPRTAQGHVARLCAKLGANTRSSAVSLAYKAGLVEASPSLSSQSTDE